MLSSKLLITMITHKCRSLIMFRIIQKMLLTCVSKFIHMTFKQSYSFFIMNQFMSFQSSFPFKYFQKFLALKCTVVKTIKGSTCFIAFFFVRNSSINEHKNMRLRENCCYEMINWILHYCGYRNNWQTVGWL